MEVKKRQLHLRHGHQQIINDSVCTEWLLELSGIELTLNKVIPICRQVEFMKLVLWFARQREWQQSTRPNVVEDMDVVAEIRDNPTAKDIRETHPTVNVVATPWSRLLQSLWSVPAMNEDTSGSLHDNNCTHHQGNDWGSHGGNGRGYRQSRGRGRYRNQQVYNAVLNDDYYYYKYPLQEQFDNLQADNVFKQKFWHVRWTCG